MIRDYLKKQVSGRLMKVKKPSFLILIIAFSLLTIIITFGLFVKKFHNYPLSDNPSDWYNFIPIIVGVVHLSITGIIAWQIQTINKKNSRRNSVLQFLGEIYIDLDNCANRYLGKISVSLADYNFDEVDVQDIMDNFEDELNKLKPKCFAFYDKNSSESFSSLLNLVRDFNFLLRNLKARQETITDAELFRLPIIIDAYVSLDKKHKRTKHLMRSYMNE